MGGFDDNGASTGSAALRQAQDDILIPHHDGLERDLRAKVRGEVSFDDAYRAMYSTDASNYRFVPICVVLPRDKSDLIATVEICRDYGAPIVHRGGGTSLAGQTCNAAVVIDSTKYLNHIVEVDYERRSAVVEPGTVLDDVRDTAAERGLTFGPAPATHNRCTLGGMIGNNSCGMSAQLAGKTEENVLELEILTYDGERMRVGPTSESELEEIIARGGRKGEIYANLRGIRDKYGDMIRKRFPTFPRRVSGFALQELLPENGFNVARALVGTEGTCVTVLEAKLQLVPDPPHKAFAIIGFDDIATAGDHVPFCNEYGPIALEGMDDSMFERIHQKGQDMHAEQSLFPEGSAWLIVQFGGQTRKEAQSKAQTLSDAIDAHSKDVREACAMSEPRDMQAILKLRDSALGVTSKIPGERDYYPGWEDSAVPPEHLGPYLREFMQKMQAYGLDGTVYGHFGQGCIHCSINFDLFTAKGIDDYRRFVTEMAYVCVKYGGSLSGEHGDGQARGELLPIMYGDELVQAFWEFKQVWDPQNKMNPGKVVQPRRLDENLRWGVDYDPPKPPTKLSFKDERHSFAYAANRCVGAGECRKHDKGIMCPSYMVTKEERYSTRGRSRLLFEMLQGSPMRGGWKSEAVKESLDYCLACKGCKHECPVNVDMASYKAEFLAHYFEGKIRPLHMWLFGYMFQWAKIASLVPGLANIVSQTPPLSVLLKRIAGIAPQRQIPMFADRTFRQWYAERGAGKGGTNGVARIGRVILWVDTWNEYFHPQTAQAALEVLEDTGYEVILPPRQVCCGRPLYDYGLLDQAKSQLREILADLRPLIREGVPLIGLEPSCLSVFKDEMRNLIVGDLDAERLAQQCFTLETFLNCDDRYKPPKLERHAVVHEHCHKKAVLDKSQSHIFDRLHLEHERLDSGCCGMAGAFGFEEHHYDMSVKCGDRVLLPKVRAAKPQTLIVADGFSCREQIEQTTKRQALHPAQVLKMALDDRGYSRDDAYPERRFIPDPRKRRERIVQQGYALFGACILASVGLAVLGMAAFRGKS